MHVLDDPRKGNTSKSSFDDIFLNQKPEDTFVKRQVWREPPEVEVMDSIRQRVREFFNGSEIPIEVKALGVLGAELFVAEAHQLGDQNARLTFSGEQEFIGIPTILGIALDENTLNVAFTSVPNYGVGFVGISSVPLEQLDAVSGKVALQLAHEKPEIVNSLLSDEVTNEERNSAKVGLVRFLGEEKPESLRISNEAGLCLEYSPDGNLVVYKLRAEEIPETDPVLGSAAEILKDTKLYESEVRELLSDISEKATSEVIAEHLRKFPRKMRDRINPYRVIEFLHKFGYKGNQAQKDLERLEGLKNGLFQFSGDLKIQMLKTFIGDADYPFDATSIDELFRLSYSKVNDKPLKDDFSFTEELKKDKAL